MKTRLALLVLVVLVAAAVVAAPASAHVGLPMMNRVTVTYDLDKGCWVGTISGHVRGVFQMTGLEYAYPNEIVYTESFAVAGRDGTMEGYVIGIYPDPDFSSTGWVTSATGRWAKMTHWMMWQSGTVEEMGDTSVAKSHVAFLPSLLDD
jgi:hypothetical protein